MPTTYATEVAGINAVPATFNNGGLQGGRVRCFRATIPYAGQASGDDIVLAVVPAGYTFAFGVITATATAGASATIAIGVTGATGKYRAGAVFTAANTPTLFGVGAAMDDSPLSASETVRATIGVASLPTSSDFAVVHLYYIAP
jgi:hypothetical protein